MSYEANQYNYATPLSSTTGLVGESNVVPGTKFFTLSDNALDGSYFPITGDVGLWGNTLSDSNGVLAEPFVVSNTELLTVNSFRLIGASDNYPVAFTVQFYSGSTLVYTITETNNTAQEYVHYLPSMVYVSGIVVTITKISKANAAARLYNIYNLPYVKRVDSLNVGVVDLSIRTESVDISGVDSIKVSVTASRKLQVTARGTDRVGAKITEGLQIVNNAYAYDSIKHKLAEQDSIVNRIDKAIDAIAVKHLNSSSVRNIIDITRDNLSVRSVEGSSRLTNIIGEVSDTLKPRILQSSALTNVHSKMKEPTRRIYGKVYITYTDPMLASTLSDITVTGSAYNSQPAQILDGHTAVEHRFFTLYDNDLSGKYLVSSVYDQVGWVSDALSDADGTFEEAQVLTLHISNRPVTSFTVYFDDSHGSVPKDFTITFKQINGIEVTKSFTNNDQRRVTVASDTTTDVIEVTISITSNTVPGHPVGIVDVPITSTFLYKGYQDESDLFSIDLLEELTYLDDVEVLGGISANEVTVVLDNSSKDFYFNSGSPVATQLKRNRKIEPYLGTEIVPGEIEWYKLGTFWSYKWVVPHGSLTATCVGFDTIGLLDITSFTKHQVLVDTSIGAAIEYVINDAKQTLPFIEFNIADELYDIHIPYAWFNAGSHTAALRKISECYPMHIYCDRDGVITAKLQKLRNDFYYDTWSDNTNVIGKTYDSLYTTLPNIVNVTIVHPTIVESAEIASDDTVFDVSIIPTRTLNFSEPYVSGISIRVDCDSTVSYTYEVYSWGIVFSFTGTGEVRSINCTGSAISTRNTSVLTNRNEGSIRVNGSVTRDISSDLIQTAEHANTIINRLLSLSEYDKYDATVDYRGDIALTINDPILLLDGIAPDNRYNIKRHQLFWNGALSGSADLNT